MTRIRLIMEQQALLDYLQDLTPFLWEQDETLDRKQKKRLFLYIFMNTILITLYNTSCIDFKLFQKKFLSIFASITHNKNPKSGTCSISIENSIRTLFCVWIAY